MERIPTLRDRDSADWEEASRCPICTNPGLVVQIIPNKFKRAKVHILRCENKLCLWYATTWMVQVNDDGTIPVRVPEADKDWKPLTAAQEFQARAEIEQAEEDTARGITFRRGSY